MYASSVYQHTLGLKDKDRTRDIMKFLDAFVYSVAVFCFGFPREAAGLFVTCLIIMVGHYFLEEKLMESVPQAYIDSLKEE
jgi:hypothetical protein